MGILDKLLGRDDQPQPSPAQTPSTNRVQSGDEQAIARYRYMLKTAPPETVEQAHAEAFAKLTPEQRTMLLQELSASIPDAERTAAGAAGNDDPHALARLATRAEVRRPGTMERAFGGMAGRGTGGMGMGGLMAGSFLSTIAGVVIGSAIAQSFFGDHGAGDVAEGEPGVEDVASDTSANEGGDAGGFDGGDFGDI